MDGINNQTQTNDVLAQFQAQPEPAATTSELDRDAFLRLLVTQMENQNPLEPQENGAFVAQLAQFSSLEGIENLNDTMTGFVESFNSNQALEASALVGRQVQVRTDNAWMQQGEPFTGVIELPTSSPEVQVSIYNSEGSLIRNISLGSQTGGEVELTWDGLDNSGGSQSSGLYRVEATALIDGENQQLETLLGANVNSVTLGTSSSEMTLNLSGIGKVPISDVRTIQ